MSRRILGVIAAIALVGIDYFLSIVSFLYTSAPEWILFAWLAAFFTALYLRLRWMIFVIHNLVTIVLLVRLVQYYQSDIRQFDPVSYGSIVFEISIIFFTNFLAWLVVRGLPRSPWFRPSNEDYSAADR